MSVATARLVLMPTHAFADLALKLTVLIAAGEPGSDEAHTFPWLYLRAILADLNGSGGADPRR